MAPLKNTLAVWNMQQTIASKVKISKEGFYKVKTNSRVKSLAQPSIFIETGLNWMKSLKVAQI